MAHESSRETIAKIARETDGAVVEPA